MAWNRIRIQGQLDEQMKLSEVGYGVLRHRMVFDMDRVLTCGNLSIALDAQAYLSECPGS